MTLQYFDDTRQINQYRPIVERALGRLLTKVDMARAVAGPQMTAQQVSALAQSRDQRDLVIMVLERLVDEGMLHDADGVRFYLDGQADPLVDLDELHVAEMNDALKEADRLLSGANLIQALTHQRRLGAGDGFVRPGWEKGERGYPLSRGAGEIEVIAHPDRSFSARVVDEGGFGTDQARGKDATLEELEERLERAAQEMSDSGYRSILTGPGYAHAFEGPGMGL